MCVSYIWQITWHLKLPPGFFAAYKIFIQCDCAILLAVYVRFVTLRKLGFRLDPCDGKLDFPIIYSESLPYGIHKGNLFITFGADTDIQTDI